VHRRSIALVTLITAVPLAAACGDDTGGGTGGGGSSTSAGATTSAQTGAPVGGATTGAASSGGGGEDTGTGGSTSTGSAGNGGAGSGGGVPGRVPVLIAQGHLGRTTISCDDGRTWIRDTSVDMSIRCWDEATGNVDCDHHAFAARGIAFGDDTFVLTWGWGQPGELHRSGDLLDWETVLTDTPTFADVAFGGGRFVANGSTSMVSDDAGATWTAAGPLDIGINTRSIDFDPAGGAFVVTGESGDQRVIVHSPDGARWTAATERPDGCITSYRGGAAGGGALVIASGQGHVCVSRDGGASWDQVELGESLSSNILWDGEAFVVYEGATAHRSADGMEWESATVDPPTISIGAAAVSELGTFVAVNDGWQRWYEQQRFYRSDDGLTWEELAEGTFTGGHPIYFVGSGTAAPSPGCGAP
jgi:hypothetical protein